MELELAWQEPEWKRHIEHFSRGMEIPVERLFAIVGTAEESAIQEAAEALEERGVGLDVSHLPKYTEGPLKEQLNRETEWVRKGAKPKELSAEDPLGLYLKEISALPKLEEEKLSEYRETRPDRLTEGYLWMVAEEALNFVGKGILLMDLMQDGALGLMRCLEAGKSELRWHIRQTMARGVALQAMVSGEAQRILASVRAYQQADRRLLQKLGRNPGPEELAQEMGKSLEEMLEIQKMAQTAAELSRKEKELNPEPEPEADQAVEDTSYFQLRTEVEELLSQLSETDRKIVTLRFGLNGKPAMSAEHAAEKLGMSLETFREREDKAMTQLRSK